MNEMEPLLLVEEVEKTFITGPEELTVLRSISLRLEPGEILSITGESGSGKTTLLSLIAGLDLPTHGSIFCAGYEVSRLNENGLTEYRSRRIGLIFQLHYLLRDFTAIENVMLPGYMAGMSRTEATERAAGLLDQVNLGPRAQHYPLQLSGGERQRVAVARSLINEPQLILADEPTGNLDERNSRVVEDLLFSLVRAHGTSLILVTHDLGLADRSGGRVLRLVGGELA
ncbi:MAG TPA: ABC transporter ATP-binding protein [Spirochaetia bacterium]|nr:ABC transporter ATP-binding protein [Spirochaetia bacterium]